MTTSSEQQAADLGSDVCFFNKASVAITTSSSRRRDGKEYDTRSKNKTKTKKCSTARSEAGHKWDRHLISAPSQSPKRARIRAPAPARPIGGDDFTFHGRRPPEMGDHEEGPAGFARARHAAFLELMSCELPDGYATQEVNHLTLAYFAVAGLSLLRELDRVNKDQIAKWILSFQVHPEANDNLDNGQFYGFCGSRTTKFPSNLVKDPCHNGSHLASTYSALATLKIVGYDVLNLDSKVLLLSMKKLQQPDGSFMPTHIGAETDLRFVYCAAAICSMLKDWSGMDKEKAKEYILNCQSYDGGFGMVPGSESHGGGTFCAVAALYLMGFIQVDLASNLRESAPIDVQLLLEWCLQRQAADGGFQGRRNKPSDTCYAFWIGGVLKMIGAYHLIDHGALREFLLTCQTCYGGFSKFPDDELPDIYHSYYGLAALSLLGEEEVEPLCAELGIIAAAL